MKEKTITKDKYSINNEEKTVGMGSIIKSFLDDKEITVPQFAIMLYESRFKYIISDHMLYKIFEDKSNMKPSQLGMFIEVANIDTDEFKSRLMTYTMNIVESGSLNRKKPYYPRKNRLNSKHN